MKTIVISTEVKLTTSECSECGIVYAIRGNEVKSDIELEV